MVAGIDDVCADVMVASPEGSAISNFDTMYPLNGSQVSAAAFAVNASSAAAAHNDVRIMGVPRLDIASAIGVAVARSLARLQV